MTVFNGPDAELTKTEHAHDILRQARRNPINAIFKPRTVALINPIAAPALDGPQALLTRLAIFYYWAADRLPERAARSLLGNPVIVRVMSIVMAKTKDPALRAWIHAQHDRYFSSFSDTRTLLEAFKASVAHTVPEYASSITRPTRRTVATPAISARSPSKIPVTGFSLCSLSTVSKGITLKPW